MALVLLEKVVDNHVECSHLLKDQYIALLPYIYTGPSMGPSPGQESQQPGKARGNGGNPPRAAGNRCKDPENIFLSINELISPYPSPPPPPPSPCKPILRFATSTDWTASLFIRSKIQILPTFKVLSTVQLYRVQAYPCTSTILVHAGLCYYRLPRPDLA